MGIANKGEVRSPVAWFFISCCTAYLGYLYLFWGKWIPEVNAALGEDKHKWFMFLIPIYNIILWWGFCGDIIEIQKKAGVKEPTNQILMFLFAVFMIPQAALNKAWEA